MAQTFNVLRKYGARAGAGALALVGGSVFAAEGDTAGAQIIAKVNEAMTSGQTIAVAVVLGFFAIWAIKLLWRAK